MKNNKSLGQHWLKDRTILEAIVDYAELGSSDTVLEIGPGLGTLTSVLLARAKHVEAVEFDGALAANLPGQFPGKSLTVHNADILSYDLTELPHGYKVVANVPYYITSKIIQMLSESPNPPTVAVLLVQKEVAQRLAAQAGDMSILAVAAQIYSLVTLGPIIPAEYFTPPPKVDSQVIVLTRRPETLLGSVDRKEFFRTIKAGFSSKRKKLRSSIAAGLALPKPDAEQLLLSADIDPNARAEALSIDQWIALTKRRLES